MEYEKELIEAIEIFMDHYEPAASYADSDDQLSTIEIEDMLKRHIGEKNIDTRSVYNILKENDFNNMCFVGEFVWPLKIKNH